MATVRWSDLTPGKVEEDAPLTSPLSFNVEAIFNSLDNIFSTHRDERLFNLDVTADLQDLLFDLSLEETASRLYSNLANALKAFEPRVRLINRNSKVTLAKDGRVWYIDLNLEIIELGSTFRYLRLLRNPI